ncbi:MAG: glutamyl-tRNA reductase [Leptospirales bacterium]
MLKLTLAGVNHKTAPVEIRERLAYPKEHLNDALRILAAREGILETFILSTCNRVEILTVTSHVSPEPKFYLDFLQETHPSLQGLSLHPYLYYLSGEEAAAHFFEVSSSLDSMVIGEPQITGQVKEAFERARSMKLAGPMLNQIFQRAISTAKRVRTETAISHLPVSISYAACQLAQKIFQDMRDKNILLLGGGDMAQLTARHMKKMGVRSLTLMTRDEHKGKELAREYEASYTNFQELDRRLVDSDIVVCSTGADSYLIGEELIASVLHRRGNKPLFLIDIAVPRNIDPAITRHSSIFLYNIDDLKSVVEANQQEREYEALQAREIVREELQSFARWQADRSTVPLIQSLRTHTESIRLAELDRFQSVLATLPPEAREKIDILTRSLLNKILHPTYHTIRQSSDIDEVREWVSKCYGLPTDLTALESSRTEDGAPEKESLPSPTFLKGESPA